MSAFDMWVSAEEESACLAEEGKFNYHEGCASNTKTWRNESTLIAEGMLAWIVIGENEDSV